MARLALIIASIYGMTAVMLGAYGAHRLGQILPKDKLSLVQTFDTGVKYQMYHALALLALGVYMKTSGVVSTVLDRSVSMLSIGTLLFSGSIYLLVALQIKDSVGLGKLGLLTPTGGVFLIIGWAMMLYYFIRN